MGLVAVKNKGILRDPGAGVGSMELMLSEVNARKWIEHTASEITHHDGDCCRQARAWILGMAQSMENASLCESGIRVPHWLSDHFEWGPSEWPISWCELVRLDIIDCGVFSALVREIFQEQGVSAHPGQVVIHYGETCTSHWRGLWDEGAHKLTSLSSARRDERYFPWVGKNLVYHEICVVESEPGVARLYDSTWGNWYHSDIRNGFGSIVAVRTQAPQELIWGDRTLRSGEWTVMA